MYTYTVRRTKLDVCVLRVAKRSLPLCQKKYAYITKTECTYKDCVIQLAKL